MTRAPYRASRKSRTVSNMARARLAIRLPARDHDAMTVHLVHIHGDSVHLRQRLLGHDLRDRADAESALNHERDTLHVVRNFVERMTDHEHGQVIALVQLS